MVRTLLPVAVVLVAVVLVGVLDAAACIKPRLLNTSDESARAALLQRDERCREGLAHLAEGRPDLAYPLLAEAAARPRDLARSLNTELAEALLAVGQSVVDALKAWERADGPEKLVQARISELVQRLPNGAAARLLRKDSRRASAAWLQARAAADGAPDDVQKRSVSAHRIGLLVPLSGRLAKLGRAVLRGARLALGRKTVLVVRDSASAPVEGLVQQLSDHGVGAIVGPVDKASAMDGAAVAQRLGVPMIQLSVAGASFVSDAKRRVFRGGINRRRQAIEQLRRVAGQGGKRASRRIAIVAPKTGFGGALGDAMVSAAKAQKARVVGRVTYAPGTTDMSSVASQLADLDIGVLFIADNRIDRAGLVLRFLARRDVWSRGASKAVPGSKLRRVHVLGPAEWRSARLPGDDARYLRGALVATEWPGAEDSGRAKFSARTEREFSRPAGQFEAMGYDAVKAIIATRGSTRRSIADKLRTATFEGVLGKVIFDAAGEPIRRPRIYRITGGKQPGQVFELLSPKRG